MTLPISLPYTLYTPPPPPDRTCHVLNAFRKYSVLPNVRVFVVPDDE